MIRKLVSALLFSQAALGQEVRNFDRVESHGRYLILSMDGTIEEIKKGSEISVTNAFRKKVISDYIAAQQQENQIFQEIQNKKSTKMHNIL